MAFKPKVYINDLGRISYAEAWDLQTKIHKNLIAEKRKYRDHPKKDFQQSHQFILCEHPAVYTLGKSGKITHLLRSERQLSEEGIEFHKINRGGDITFHGPGQIVGYPIFDLDEFFTDVHRYVRTIEQSIIETIADYGCEGVRMPGYTGVWLPESNDLPNRKICAIGVHLSRWVTMHGFALNVNTDLDYFQHIVPCGINEENMDVTSLGKELGQNMILDEVKIKITENFARNFNFEIIRSDISSLDSQAKDALTQS